jgi:hypothetical protein
VLDDYSLLRHATEEALLEDLHLFPVRRTFWYVQDNMLGRKKGYQGDSLYNAENPDYGAVIRYHVKDGWKSMAAGRKEKEAKLRKSGGDVPTPSFDDLQAEKDEIPPRHYLDITDTAGTVVARLDLSTSEGIHKVVWEMQYEGLFSRGGGPLVAPGKYTAQAFRSLGAEATAIGNQVSFDLESVVTPTLPLPNRKKTLKQIEQMGLVANRSQSLNRKLDDRLEEVTELISRIKNNPKGTAELLDQAQRLRHRMDVFDRQLNGDELKDDRWAMTKPGINQRIGRALSSALSGTHGPTKAAMEQYEIGKKQFEEIESKIEKLLDRDFPSLESAIDAAKIPRIELEIESGEDED